MVTSMKGLTDFIMIKSKNIIKRVEKKSIIEFLDQPTRPYFGNDGSIYVLNEGNRIIQKFPIMNNICQI
jgi:hypothetical protein